jgi:hypothetical protein
MGICSTKNYEIKRLNFLLNRTKISKLGCTEWCGYKNKWGYGIASFYKTNQLVHRIIWTILKGPIQKDMCILHRCDNPSCININHLFLGTNYDNIADRCQKGRTAIGLSNGKCKLSDKMKISLLQMAKENIPYKNIAEKFKISQSHISNLAIENGIRRKNGR